jgi:hypothetical protein
MITRLIGGFVAILVGVSIIPMITKEVNIAANTTNVTGVSATILKMVPGFFALGILGIGIAVAYSGLRSAGLMGGGRDEESELETAVDTSYTHHDGEYISTPVDTYKPKKTILTTKHTEYKRVYTDEGGKFD